MANSINLNQKFSTMSQVQTYFGDNARIVSYGLASDFTLIEVDHYTFTRSSIYGDEAYIVVIELADTVETSFIPSNVADTVQRAVNNIKSFNVGVVQGRELDKRFSGCGRYESDTFRNTSCAVAQHTIGEFVKHAYKNGIDAIGYLNAWGFESAAVLSESAKGWA
jgi:hypothetical protein